MLYVDLPTTEELTRLANARKPGSVTIVLPTTKVTQDIGASIIELKNLAKEAARQLRDAAFDKRKIAAIEEQIEDLAGDDAFWAHQATSLALYVTPDNLATFRLPTRLEPLVEVADRFHIKPLIRALAFPDVAFILALSENNARLVEMHGDLPAEALKVDGLPKNMDAAGARAKSRDVSPGGRFQGGAGETFHRRTYARKIDAALRPLLAGRDIPLVLACVDEFDAIYRTVNSYEHLAAEIVKGNPDRLSVSELAESARPILQRLHAGRIAALNEQYLMREKQGRAGADLALVARAAAAGAIDTLLVDIDAVVDGTLDEATGAIAIAKEAGADSYDIVDEIAGLTLRYGGRAIGLRKADLPVATSPLAAIYRYPA
ncbi:baeRF11 domain-containing protein [Taklimakanibacter deserti]|uniref:baeRF11 domain-containing protein n=1 Tax=Taklimakanibacter deserti TaxID=2267839 RepID=UPI000E657342